MSHFWSTFTFASVALLILYGAHRYAWARYARDVRFSRAWKIGTTVALVLLGLSVPTAFFFSRRNIGEGKLNLTFVAYLWLGFLFYSVLLLAGFDLARLVAWVVRRVRGVFGATRSNPPQADVAEPLPARQLDRASAVVPAKRNEQSSASDAPSMPERRVFLARAAAGTAALSSGAIAIGGYRAAMGEITTPEIDVRLARLPRELSGYRIVQMSDLHLGPTLATRFLEAVVEKTNAQRPDLVVITGDMVDGRVATLGPALAPLAKLSARHGVVFVTGNHEYYSGAEEWIAYLRKQGIRVLMNERLEIGDGVVQIAPSSTSATNATSATSTSGETSAASAGDDLSRAMGSIGSARTKRVSFDLAGIPDQHAGGYFADHAPDLDHALVGRDPERELVLLAHQPSQIAMASGHGVGLQLSGHTHGGQMWPFGALVSLVQPYVAGHHRHPDGTQIYVSRGTGFWGPPMRVGNPAEIATIVLVAG